MEVSLQDAEVRQAEYCFGFWIISFSCGANLFPVSGMTFNEVSQDCNMLAKAHDSAMP